MDINVKSSFFIMTVVGDSVYIIGILVPLITAFFRNVLAHAVGIVFGTVGMLVFFGGFTDVAIGSASFISRYCLSC